MNTTVSETTAEDTNLTTVTTQEITESTTTYVTNVVLTTTTSIISTTNTSSNGNSGNEGGGMSGGAQAGVIIGCLIVGVLIVGVALFLWRRKRKEEKRKRRMIENPLPGVNYLQELDLKQIDENKKKKKSKQKKSKKVIIEKEPPSNVSVTSYVNVPKEKNESPYANTTKDGAQVVPISEEPSSGYEEPQDLKLQYSGAGGIEYYTTKNNNKKEDDYDIPAQKPKEKKNNSKINQSQHTKDYVNVPKKLPPGQAPKPGKSIRREESTDSQQQVYENVESENKT